MTNKNERLTTPNSELRTRPRGALCIDVGNSETVLGLFEGFQLRQVIRRATGTGTSSEDWDNVLGRLFQDPLTTDHPDLFQNRDPDSAGGRDWPLTTVPVVASVVPAVNEPLTEALSRLGLSPPLFVTTEMSGLRTEYRHPEAIGADRVANAVAAIELYGCPAIVVDLGTATTVDAISAEGVFLGGAIAPGVETSARALADAAALLPQVPLELPPMIIGRETVEAMQSGILYGAAAMIDGLVERIAEELIGHRSLVIGHHPEGVSVIATGGLAELIAPLCRTVQHVDPLLTLKGLRIIGQRAGETGTAD